MKNFDCEDVHVFDIYYGGALPDGKKSVTLNLIFRAGERTLKDKEVNLAFDAIQKLITEKTDYLIRK